MASESAAVSVKRALSEEADGEPEIVEHKKTSRTTSAFVIRRTLLICSP
jgi:hypothetical protein